MDTLSVQAAVHEFFFKRRGTVFKLETMQRYVNGRCGGLAEKTPERTMRMMRQRGEIKYSVVGRMKYRAETPD